MILADKIMKLRKENGWSQEELANRLQVSRQSVSKWEGAQAVPDLKRIMKLSEIFGVSTDYLLKDEMEEIESKDAPFAEQEEVSYHMVTMEEANAFLALKDKVAKLIAIGVALCITSPVMLIFLGGLSAMEIVGISIKFATGVGMIILLCMVACAVGLFVYVGNITQTYEYLETDPIETEYGVEGMVREQKAAYGKTFVMHMVLGVSLCIFSVVPIFVGMILPKHARTDIVYVAGVCLLLILVAIGVFQLILGGVVNESFEKLLQEGEYSLKGKQVGRQLNKIAGIYWLTITAIFLLYSFVTNDWGRSWIIWPVAGVSFGILAEILKFTGTKD